MEKNTLELFVVVAQDRLTEVRKEITKPLGREEARIELVKLSSDRTVKKSYRYFAVARYPYKSKRR